MSTTETAGPLPSTRRSGWRSRRAPFLVGGIVLLAALLVALLGGDTRTGALDPRAVDPAGSKAVAQVLGSQGVQVELVQTTQAALSAAGSGTTLLLVYSGRLAPRQLDRLRGTRADLVLVAPTRAALSALAPEVRRVGPAAPERRDPGCTLPAAQRAGTAEVASTAYTAAAPRVGTVSLCYGNQEASQGLEPAAPLVHVRTPARAVTVLGDDRPLTNARLDQHGNAALALGVLGAQPRLVWYLPSPEDVPLDGDEDPFSLVPAGVRYGVAMLAVAVVLIALGQGRRLGPVVVEPLPVVVRAAETAEGRARLYRRNSSRDRAAEALRSATRDRIRSPLALPRGVEPEALTAATSARSALDPGAVAGLLYGGVPPDDAALVRLAAQLDALEREVRRS